MAFNKVLYMLVTREARKVAGVMGGVMNSMGWQKPNNTNKQQAQDNHAATN